MIKRIYLDDTKFNIIGSLTPAPVQREMQRAASYRCDTAERHMSYSEETQMMLCVKNGEVEKLAAFAQQRSKEGLAIGAVAENALMQSRFVFVSGITMFTRFAIEGGLAEEEAYELSDAYIRYIAEVQSTAEIHQLMMTAGLDFAKRVRARHAARSLPIKQCCAYVSEHLYDKITLHDLAQACKRAESYVSSTFKRQFGISPMAYVMREKLAASRVMLLSDDASVADIAAQLCFCSHSNFSQHFKRMYGTSPAEYRLHAHSLSWNSLQ